MKLINNHSHLIQKEDIKNFKFPKAEVLKDEFSMQVRAKNILRGLKLGNKFKNKVHIYFEDSVSLKRVETTIWGVTQNYLILKSNMLIPIKRVHSVNF